jgi:hypothetical protein
VVFPWVKTKKENLITQPFFWVTCTQHHHNLFHNICPKQKFYKLNILEKNYIIKIFGCFKIDYNPIQVWVSISAKDDFMIEI